MFVDCAFGWRRCGVTGVYLNMARLAVWIVICAAVPLCCSAQKAVIVRDTDVSSVRYVSDVKKPTKLVTPTYPESAKLAGIQGSVVLDIVIGKSGEVENAQAISGPKELWSAAAEAVKRWKWEPVLLNEKPIRLRTKVTVNFVLEESHSPRPKAGTH
jgi:TonB family protein